MYWALQFKLYTQNHEHFPLEINLSKNIIAQHFGLPPEAAPHQALNGVDHLILCYKTVVGFG
jgi:DNA polymerase-3 subunit epsilon/oligoribonuclease